jgi:hypothetical protein
MPQINTDLITDLKNTLSLELRDSISYIELEEVLSKYVNELISKNFEKLVSVLYRIDVSEKKLKYLLKSNADENAGKIIAQLIIERQLEKIKSRKENTMPAKDDDEFEKW